MIRDNFLKKPIEYNNPHFGVMASGISGNLAPCTTKTFDHIANTGFLIQLYAGNVERTGVQILASSPAIGTSIKKVQAKFTGVGSPTGTVFFTIRDSATDTVQITSDSLDTTGWTTEATYEFTFPSPYTLSSGDRIQAEQSGLNGANHVQMGGQTKTIETYYTWSYYATIYYAYVSNENSMTFDSAPTC